MKKILLFAAALFMLNACNQQSIDPISETASKPPKTTCGGAECEEEH